MESQQSKAAVLQNCIKLWGKEVPHHLSKVFITPDMTPKERENNKALKAELAELNKGGKNYQIKMAS